ncbi:MAG: hypothetical protein LBR81_00720 [Prevotellaceae bacterium]|jgi:hypothetical protein|nr:hypothetical protein [Prevotellaceae bacterium]
MKLEAKLTPELIQTINCLSKQETAKGNIEVLDEMKNFLIANWEDLPDESDREIKTFLLDIHYMQQLFRAFVQK